jgi:DNA-binding protein HU-beta
MNKQTLVDSIAQSSGLTKKAVTDVLNQFIESVMGEIKKGGTVTLTGFGTFKSIKTKARQGRNPKTGQKITIPAKRVPRFSAGKAFKELVK